MVSNEQTLSLKLKSLRLSRQDANRIPAMSLIANGANFAPYLANCFWLILPPLALNLVCARRLPRSYQPQVFDRDIPRWIAAGEHAFRTLAMLLPFTMVMQIRAHPEKIGWLLYVVGCILYGVSWAAQIYSPRSAWSRSALGFMAPGYTPLSWLVGIGLIGDRSFLTPLWRSWIYVVLVAVFLGFHNAHAWRVWKQTRASSDQRACA
jgi:hypothetical protein